MNKLEKIGKILKDTRESRSLKLTDISEVLKIRKKYLESIEKGKHSEIPGKAYIDGYVKMYAEHLGISSEVKKIQQEGKAQRVKFSQAKKHLGDNWILASIFSILIIVLLFLVWLRSYDSNQGHKNSIEIMLEDDKDNS